MLTSKMFEGINNHWPMNLINIITDGKYNIDINSLDTYIIEHVCLLDKNIIELRYKNKFTYDQIAYFTGVDRQFVLNRLKAVINKLKYQFSENNKFKLISYNQYESKLSGITEENFIFKNIIEKQEQSLIAYKNKINDLENKLNEYNNCYSKSANDNIDELTNKIVELASIRNLLDFQVRELIDRRNKLYEEHQLIKTIIEDMF